MSNRLRLGLVIVCFNISFIYLLDLDASRHEGQVDGGYVPGGQLRVVLQPGLLLGPVVQESVDDVLRFFCSCIFQEP